MLVKYRQNGFLIKDIVNAFSSWVLLFSDQYSLVGYQTKLMF